MCGNHQSFGTTPPFFHHVHMRSFCAPTFLQGLDHAWIQVGGDQSGARQHMVNVTILAPNGFVTTDGLGRACTHATCCFASPGSGASAAAADRRKINRTLSPPARPAAAAATGTAGAPTASAPPPPPSVALRLFTRPVTPHVECQDILRLANAGGLPLRAVKKVFHVHNPRLFAKYAAALRGLVSGVSAPAAAGAPRCPAPPVVVGVCAAKESAGESRQERRGENTKIARAILPHPPRFLRPLRALIGGPQACAPAPSPPRGQLTSASSSTARTPRASPESFATASTPGATAASSGSRTRRGHPPRVLFRCWRDDDQHNADGQTILNRINKQQRITTYPFLPALRPSPLALALLHLPCSPPTPSRTAATA